MAKQSGSTKTSTSRNPRGVSNNVGGVSQSNFNSALKDQGAGEYYAELKEADVSIIFGPAKPGTGASEVAEIRVYDNTTNEFEPTVKLYDASKTQVKQRAYEEYLKVVKRHQ